MTTPEFTRDDYEQTASVIRARIDAVPKVALVLGSGLGPLANRVENAVVIPYNELPNWPTTTVVGHQGRLVIGQIEGRKVLVMQGRPHFYEGYSMAQVGYPVRVMQMLGIETLIVTNAAGGINQSFEAGDLMLIEDHINFVGHTGLNPLIGPNDKRLGPRFPIFTQAYDASLRQLATAVAEREGIRLHKGVYIWLSGPAFETPAEIRMFRQWGADAVGMSTVPEVIVARHAGIRVLGISSITNISIDSIDSKQVVSHEEVLDIGRQIVPKLITILTGILREMSGPNHSNF